MLTSPSNLQPAARQAGTPLREVLLLLGPTCEYTRRVTEGVGRFARERGRWNVTSADSLYHEQVFDDYDGVITATLSEEQFGASRCSKPPRGNG